MHRTSAGIASGIIVEVEAYVGEDDAACHAAPGPTARNAPMYGEPGHAYVYLNYGIHALMNVVTEPPGFPAAVLVRALEPLEGIRLMRRRRQARGAPEIPEPYLCRGPGNLTRALGVTLKDNEADLLGNRLSIEDAGRRVRTCAWSPRIGIRVATDRLWRCYVPESLAVSGPRKLQRPT